MAVTVLRDRRVAYKLPFSPAELTAALEAMLAACGGPGLPLEISLVDDAAMAEHNSRFLGCPGPTNVLSFPAPPVAPGKEPSPALLLLSADTLLRESLLYGQNPAEHALRLLAHGVVHLLGLDHGPAMEALCAQAEDAGRAALDAAGLAS